MANGLNTDGIIQALRKANYRFNNLPSVARIVFIPALTTVIGLMILKFSSNAPLFVNLFLIFSYIVVIVFGSLANYANAESSKARREHIHLFKIIIESIEQCVKEKKRRLASAISNKENNKSSSVLISIKKRLSFDSSVSTINHLLFITIGHYLRVMSDNGDAPLCLVLLVPDSNGNLILLGSLESAGNSSRIVHRNTNININDKSTLAGRLWHDKSTNIRYTNNSLEEESQGKFVFFDEDERIVLKSVLCYKVLHPITGDPCALWSIDSNKNDVFLPVATYNNHDFIEDIVRIFSCFSNRLGLEILYKEALDLAEPYLSERID